MKINSRGQVTIPKDIRERAGLLPGCEVKFEFVRGKVFLILVRKGAIRASKTATKLRCTLK